MDFLAQTPSLLRVVLAFGIILIAIRRNLALGSSFLLGTVALGLLFGLNPLQILSSMATSVSDLKTLSLALIVGLILILSTSMEKAGQMQRLLDNFRGLVTSARLNLTLFPALIGLLPMPGGAIFSAPMVKELGDRSELSEDQLSFVNYWFRHIWEYWWPLYPGVLLTALMADINLVVLVVFMAPLTVAAVYFGQRPIKDLRNREQAPEKKTKPPLGPFLKEMVPIFIVIVPGLGIGMLISYVFPNFGLAKESGLILFLCLAIVWVWCVGRFNSALISKLLISKHLLKIIYMVLGILVFKGILTDSRAVTFISDDLIALGIPLLLIVIAIPLLVGTVTGLTIAFVGSTFPILIPMIQSFGESQFMLAYVMLALVSGFVGVLLSPLHLCLVLSNEYFKTSQFSVHKYLWYPCAAMVIVGFGYFWVLHWGLSLA